MSLTPDRADSPAGDPNRTGRYVDQPTGHQACLPALLPPDPPIRFDANLQDRLSEATRNLDQLNGALRALPDPERFETLSVLKEAVLSSRIEDIHSPLRDVLAAEAGLPPGGPRTNAHRTLDCARSVRHGLDRLPVFPVCSRLLREIHARLMAGESRRLTPGEFRVTQNWIGPAGCLLAEATYVPPPPHELPRALGNLEDFIHQPDGLPPLVRVGIAHAQFETIHPFLDGNGRVGRALITLMLRDRDLLDRPVLCLSGFLLRRRAEYYGRLQAIRDAGGWEGWLAFFLEGVAQAGTEAVSTARHVLELRERHHAAVATRLGRAAPAAHRALELVWRKSVVTVAQVREAVGTTHASANNLVGSLVRAGILEELTGNRRNRAFGCGDLIRAFDGKTDPPVAS